MHARRRQVLRPPRQVRPLVSHRERGGLELQEGGAQREAAEEEKPQGAPEG
jgi:hypothetical protein